MSYPQIKLRLFFFYVLMGLSFLLNAQMDLVEEQLKGISEHLRGEGFKQSHDTELFSLGRGETKEFQIELDASQQYNIWGVCDNDCTDLDLSLVNLEGNFIDQDVLEDDQPLINPIRPISGTYYLRATMHACNKAVCKVGLLHFSQAAPPLEMDLRRNIRTEDPREFVNQQLNLLETSLANVGLNSYKENEYVELGSDEIHSLELKLVADKSYQFWSVCDGNCGDIDLAIFDETGELVQQDIELDAQPSLQLSDLAAGNYTLRVTMYECVTTSCQVGLSFKSN